MLSRNLSPTLARLAQTFPVVAVTGPRQSGKTTLVRALFPDKPFVSLEDPVARAFAQEDPQGFLSRYDQGPHGAIFDEAQRWPELFSYLQGFVDRNRQAGRFILTGSQQFDLMAGVTQSLAGRVGITRLLPLASNEWPAQDLAQVSLNHALIRGAYPEMHDQPLTVATDWFSSYVTTYVERDVRQLLRVTDLSTFQRFMRLCAGRTGQLLNITALASESGITRKTAQTWLDVLQASDLLTLLPPYHRNFGKRLVKTPKLYFVDTGLACWLLGIREQDQLALHPMRGALFENWVISDALKHRYNKGLPAELYFWRDNNGLEADLVFERGSSLQTIEIKSGQTVTSDYIKAGKKSAHFANGEALVPWLVHGGEDQYTRSGVEVIGWRQWAEKLLNSY